MNAFYEKKKGRLYKFFIKDRQPFGVAGIWENWRNPAKDWNGRSASLPLKQTISPKIHNRMPAIIDAADHQRWSDGLKIFLCPTRRKMSVIPGW
jgi:putative SOS response-associated peptidase YedK